jgi:hypothetical protein
MIEIETPDDKEVQKVTFSSYKHRNTAKFLACLAAFGALAWISVAYPGSISDKDITEVSGFLNICVHPYQMTIAALAWLVPNFAMVPEPSSTGMT